MSPSGQGEDYRWGFADGILEALVPEAAAGEGEGEEGGEGEESSEYHGTDYEEGDEKPIIELPPGVTLLQAYDYCTKNLTQPGCKDLVNFCNVDGCADEAPAAE